MRILIFGTVFEDSAERAELTDLWVKLHRALNPNCDLLLVDSNSPYHPYMGDRHPGLPLLRFADNIGHLGKGGRDGWGRAFCRGLHHAIIGDYDWVVHIEGDSLCREPIRPAVVRFAAEGIRVIAPALRPGWVETGLMMFSVGWLTGHEFIPRYNWDKRLASPHPEEVIYELIGRDLHLLPWAVLRDDASKLAAAFLGNYCWISHTTMDNFRRFAELGAQPARLHFGCGNNRLPGWANYDAEVDISKPLLFPDNSAEAIFCEHVLEHVPLRGALIFLTECFRVLKPGGRLRIAVPSIEQIEQQADTEYIAFVSQWARADLQGTLRGALDAIINAHGHQMIWTAASLQAVVHWAGFECIWCCHPGQSQYPDFVNLEGHGKVIGERFNRIETVVVEAASQLFDKYCADSMIERSYFIANLALIEQCDLPGAFVECGTWRGGMSAAMMEVGGRGRDYAFFDSFAGLPPAGAIDGPLAAAWQADIYSPRYYNNCTSSLDQFQATIAKTGFAEKARVYPGWFDDTFPLVKPFPIALLRIDVDWYKPTFACLLKFWSMLVPDALVLLDDYYVWPGCRQAVDVFLAQHAPTVPVCHHYGPAPLAYLIKPSTP